MAKRGRVTARAWSAAPLAAPVAMLAVLAAPQAHAEWRYIPAVDFRQTYSSNPGLLAPESAHGQFITEVSPSLSVVNEGPRLKLRGSVSEHLYAFSGDRAAGTTDSQLQLTAEARAKLIGELLFLDANAAIGQQAISAFGPQAYAGGGYSDNNRTDVRTWRVSPYLAHSFGTSMTGELRYTRDSVQAGMGGLSDSHGNSASASLASGPSFRTVGWGLQYMKREDFDDTLAIRTEVEIASANLSLRVARSLALTANGGYDRYDYESPGQPIAGRNYAVGFNWTPSSRTSVQASAGRRFYGKTYSLQSSHRSRGTVWTVNYNDAITNSREQFLLPATISTAATLDRLFSASIPDPVARQRAVEAYIRATGLPPSLVNNINYFSNRFFLQRQLVASAAFNLPRTTAVLALTSTKRSAVSSQETNSDLLGSNLLSQNDNNKQQGVSMSANYRLTPRSSANLTFNRTRTKSLTTSQRDNNQQLSLGVAREFRRNLKATVDLRRSTGNGNFQGGPRTYRENAISASLSLTL